MAQIVGIEGLSGTQIQLELQQGARFVMYQYCISVVILSFKRFSSIHFIRPGESAVGKGLGWSLLALVLGWWGIPWGPIWTIQALWVNFSGGRDVTNEVLAAMQPVQSMSRAQGV
jgi:hypothetical protein